MWKEFLVIYLSSFRLSNEQVKNPNIYPYHVFRGKDMEPFVFSPITVLYGNNGSGKSTILNIMANKLMVKGREYATSNSFGIVDYCGKFSAECCFSYGAAVEVYFADCGGDSETGVAQTGKTAG